MDNNTLQIKFDLRLNKLASFDYDNIECWQKAEAFNKAQIEWVRKQVHGKNQKQEGDESSKVLIDDLQKIMIDIPIAVTTHDGYVESDPLPTDYLFFKRISAKSTTECCKDGRIIVIYLAEEANVDELCIDNFKKPSAEWGESFCTMIGNRIRIYTNNEFGLTDVKLTYYRYPQQVTFANCIDTSSGFLTLNNPCEFKDDIVEMILDDAVGILAGGIESFNQFTVNKQNAIQTN
jgi:hypothetical protein